MSRTGKAVRTAFFGYLQFTFAFASGLLVFPFVLRTVPAQDFGLWMAAGELIGFAGLVDLGVLMTLPLLAAQADGRKDRVALRQLISDCLFLSTLAALLFLAVTSVLWSFRSELPGLARYGDATLVFLETPLLVLAVGYAVALPLRTFAAVLTGLQDVTCLGVLALVQAALGLALTLGLLTAGFGLQALAWAAAAPPLAVSLVAVIRLALKQPDLLKEVPWPAWARMKVLLREGFGSRLGGFGWQLVSASQSIIIVRLLEPELAVVYACTAKLPMMLMQMVWLLTDSGLIGFAQLHGEGNQERTREVSRVMLRVSLAGASCAGVVVLLLNPLFVRLWVGEPRFGGIMLNALLAAWLLVATMIHSFSTQAASIGARFQVGSMTLVQGLIHLPLAALGASLLGLNGLLAGALTAGTLIGCSLQSILLSRCLALPGSVLWRKTVLPSLSRVMLVFLLAALASAWLSKQPAWYSAAGLLSFAGLGLVVIGPLLVGAPLPSFMRRLPWLRSTA